MDRWGYRPKPPGAEERGEGGGGWGWAEKGHELGLASIRNKRHDALIVSLNSAGGGLEPGTGSVSLITSFWGGKSTAEQIPLTTVLDGATHSHLFHAQLLLQHVLRLRSFQANVNKRASPTQSSISIAYITYRYIRLHR